MNKRYPAVMLIRGLDIGTIPPTPIVRGFDSTLDKPKKILLEAASNYGFPISFAQEQDGILIQNVYPVPTLETKQISSSSKVELGLHTETAFHQYKPTVVLLLCLRGDPNAVTTYASIDEIIQNLAPSAISTLTKPWFITSVDESFRMNGEPNMEIPCSILRQTGDTNSYEICYDQTLMRGINDEATSALRGLEEAINLSVNKVVLDVGDLLVIDNTKVVHGRLPFEARYDGSDRWLQRILAIDNLPPKPHSALFIDREFPSIVSAKVEFVPISVV